MYIMDGYDALRPEDMVSSTAPGETPEAWDAGTTYLKGDLVFGSDGLTVYEAAIGPATYLAGSYCGAKYGEGLDNVGNNPEEYPTVPAMDRTQYPDYVEIDDCYKESGLMWWIKRGEYWENKYRMFQESPDLITTGEANYAVSEFSVTCLSRQAASGIAFFRTVATSITVTCGSDTYTFDMLTGKSHIPGGDIYTRWADDLPFNIPAATEFTVTFTHDRNLRLLLTSREDTVAASCGFLALGRWVKIGTVLYQSQIGVHDFSRKERDAFGRAIIQERDFTYVMSYKVSVPTEDIYIVSRFLAMIRATLSVFGVTRGSPEPLTVGYIKDFDIPIEGYTDSIFTLQVEGL